MVSIIKSKRTIFPCLPKKLRYITGCNKLFFKRKLDEFLSSVPNEPLVFGLSLKLSQGSKEVISKSNFNDLCF